MAILKVLMLTKAFRPIKTLISTILLRLQCKLKNIVKVNLVFIRIK